MDGRWRLVLLGAVVVVIVAGVYSFSTRTPRLASAGPAEAKSQPSGPDGTTPVSAASSGTVAADTSSPGAGPDRPEFVVPALTMQPFSPQDLQTLTRLPVQQQAEQMMMAAVNHYQGATGMILERVQGWRGQLKKTSNWDTVELAARYSSDLRVRDAAIEVDLAIYQLERTPATAQKLIDDAQTNIGHRGFDLNALGMLANRGVETSRIHDALRDWAHDSDEGTRYWAIEGLAYIGADDTIPDFVDILGHDPSLNVRQRCGASLAKSGMLTREKRMAAVPGLLDIAADSAQDATTRGWALQALREITGEGIGNDAAAWRAWFDAHGDERMQQFRGGDPNVVLGNS